MENKLTDIEAERLAENRYNRWWQEDERVAYIAGYNDGYNKGREHHDEMLEMLKRAVRYGTPLPINQLITKIESNG